MFTVCSPASGQSEQSHYNRRVLSANRRNSGAFSRFADFDNNSRSWSTEKGRSYFPARPNHRPYNWRCKNLTHGMLRLLTTSILSISINSCMRCAKAKTILETTSTTSSPLGLQSPVQVEHTTLCWQNQLILII